jgi:hypothetical protein
MKKPRLNAPENLKIDAQKKDFSKNIKPIKKTEEKKEEKTSELKILPLPLQPVTVIGVIPKKTYKLKITATDIQCIASTDRDKIDDYEINQSVLYKAKGKIKRPISRDFNSYRLLTKRLNLSEEQLIETMLKGFVDDYIFEVPRSNRSGASHQAYVARAGVSRLIYGNYGKRENKDFFTKASSEFITIGAKEGAGRNLKNLNNSMVFQITQEELNDTNAEMIIYTLVSERSSEYSSDTIHYNHDGTETYVAIKDVLDILTGNRKLNATDPYLDGAIAKGIKFDKFDGFKLPLTKVNYPTKTILEGPIRARGKTAANKAALWIRFELID